jgi:hypothetical protein
VADAGRVAALLRWGAALFAGAVLVVSAGATAEAFGLWPDERMPAAEAAERLQARLGTPYAFTCEPEEADETLPADVDYLCSPADPEQQGWWIETDDDSIQLVAVTG